MNILKIQYSPIEKPKEKEKIQRLYTAKKKNKIYGTRKIIINNVNQYIKKY